MEISAKEFKNRIALRQKFQLLDVREVKEFANFNIGGTNKPISQFPENFMEVNWGKEEEIIVVCLHGIRSENAVTILQAIGFKSVFNLKGGLIAYNSIL